MTIDLSKYVDDFKEIINDCHYDNNGMFNSEIYPVYVLYKELGCNLFIESGIDNAVSTKKYLKLITDEYVGIDLNKNCAGSIISQSNFKFISGDSVTIIKNIIDEKKDNKIFIMIDGPKGSAAMHCIVITAI